LPTGHSARLHGKDASANDITSTQALGSTGGVPGATLGVIQPSLLTQSDIENNSTTDRGGHPLSGRATAYDWTEPWSDNGVSAVKRRNQYLA
jgi:hypothetical protein